MKPRLLRETFPVGPLRCNCTLLANMDSLEAIVVDPGDEIADILARLARHHLTLKQIIVTHAHIDHIGGAAQLKRVTGAPVLFHQADLPILDMLEMQAGWLGIPTPEKVVLDQSANDGLATGIPGLEAEVIHTPGHTPGSICLLFPKQELLLAGDTLFAGSVGRTDLPGGDTSTLLHSIHTRVLLLPERTLVVPGHGEETTLGQERETNPFLQPDMWP
ncbi:MAG: MBL fold metallo-hydrolase [Acidobacteriaceae bacterium]|jgi:glyoxylase-like metal-dependent hydrolase (beta-lactamase superfamily II)